MLKNWFKLIFSPRAKFKILAIETMFQNNIFYS